MADAHFYGVSGAAPYACKPEQSRGRLVVEPEGPTRTVYQRDRDRIIHSTAFRKLRHKTQVFVSHAGEDFRTRLTHSLEVAQIARSISRALGLNEDLAEAVALAHDLGHTPFGHAGEEALDACMEPYGGFSHNDQTLRILTQLERRYADFDGLNLTWETLEGVVKHNGPMLPTRDGKPLPTTLEAFRKVWDLELDTQPSAEAQVAALSDDIAYNNHDVEDGLRAGLFTISDLEELPLVGPIFSDLTARYSGIEENRLIHEAIRRMIDFMVIDLLEETGRRLAELAPRSADDIRRAREPVVAFSEEMRANDRALRAFLRHRMYRHYRVNREASKGRRVVRELFTLLMAEPQCLPTEWQLQIGGDGEKEHARAIADYIAGMTDRSALDEHARLFDLSSRS